MKIYQLTNYTHVQMMCYVIVTDGGKVIALGNHNELMRSSEIYREIYQAQTRGKEEQTGGEA